MYLDNCPYKFAYKQMADDLDDNLFEDRILLMLPYNYHWIDISEGIDLLKVIYVKNAWFVTIGILTMKSNFKILYAMAVMIWQFCALI